MKIGIIGATGMSGVKLFKEATARNHDVVAIVRNKEKALTRLGNNIKYLEKDVFDLTREDLAGFDVVINAFSATPATAYLHVDLTTKLISFFRGLKTPRLFFILGAGSLLDQDGHLVLDRLQRQEGNEAWISIPLYAYKQLAFLREVDDVNWVGVSPAELYYDGGKTDFIVGKDQLLYAASGASKISSGNMAAAILNEIEQPQFINTRFTVADK